MLDAPTAQAIGSRLSEQEAASRLQADGPNELARTGRRTPSRIVLEVMREPMLALLLGGGMLYLLLGSPEEALILLAFALFSIVITVVQESRTERVLEALRDLTNPRVLVMGAWGISYARVFDLPPIGAPRAMRELAHVVLPPTLVRGLRKFSGWFSFVGEGPRGQVSQG